MNTGLYLVVAPVGIDLCLVGPEVVHTDLYFGLQEAVHMGLCLEVQEAVHKDLYLAGPEVVHTDPCLAEPGEHMGLCFEVQEEEHKGPSLVDTGLSLLEAAEDPIHMSSLLAAEDIVLSPVLAEGHKGLSAGYRHLLACYRTRFVPVL